LFCPIHEDTPGPADFDTEAMAAGVVRFRATGDPSDPSRLTLAMVRDELARIVGQRADPRLAYLDGRELYGPADHDELPLPDALHLDAPAHRRVGERFAVRLAGEAWGTTG
jgi:hypothetical protein